LRLSDVPHCQILSSPLTKLNRGLSQLHSADEYAVSWLTNYGSWHANENNKQIDDAEKNRWKDKWTDRQHNAAACQFGLAEMQKELGETLLVQRA